MSSAFQGQNNSCMAFGFMCKQTATEKNTTNNKFLSENNALKVCSFREKPPSALSVRKRKHF